MLDLFYPPTPKQVAERFSVMPHNTRTHYIDDGVKPDPRRATMKYESQGIRSAKAERRQQDIIAFMKASCRGQKKALSAAGIDYRLAYAAEKRTANDLLALFRVGRVARIIGHSANGKCTWFYWLA